MSPHPSLEGRVAIVTGAGTLGTGIGVGKAISVVLAQQGAKLVLVDVAADRARETEALVRDEGAESLVCVGDISRAQDCEAVLRQALDAFGTVDILVNN